MKKVIALLMLCTIGYSNTEAQLLKKLKDKAQKALETKTPETSSNTNSNSNTNANSNTNGNSKTSTTPTVNNADPKNDKKQWVPTPDCQVVFTLEAGEEFFYDETEVFVKDNKMSSSFVIKNKKGEYFVIEDGKRTGPFKEVPAVTVYKADEEEGQSDNESIEMGGDKKDPVAIQYSKTINGKLFIVFNGKNFGPYDYVNKMIVSPDKKQFFAAVTIGGANAMTAKMGMGNIFIVNEAILKQQVGSGSNSMPTKFKVSNGFKHCMVTVMETSSQKMLSVTSSGKKQEADMSEMYAGNNNTILNDNGDIISIPSQSPTQIFLNGEEVTSFKVPIKSMSRLFLLPDIKKSVYYTNGKLYRADGSEESVSNILFPKLLIINKEAAIYYYKLYKNDKGTYDVYICKKIL